MTKEEKELLLKDLCARLPYYPKCEMIDELRVVNYEKDSSYISTLFPKHIELFSYHNNFTIKPYLRPMSSMTEEEDHEFALLQVQGGIDECKYLYACDAANMITWLNRHHFDYGGLIEKGLALEAPEGMYKEK